MKILIAYASKNGTAASCAELLKSKLSNLDVTVVDLAKNMPDPADYDMIISGGSVRFGKLLSPLTRFWETHKQTLLEKPLGLFFCCGNAHDYEYYHDTLLPADLRAVAFQSLYFGGSLRRDGLPFFDKLIISSLRSSIIESEIEDGEFTPALPSILPENVERMATYIRMELSKLRKE